RRLARVRGLLPHRRLHDAPDAGLPRHPDLRRGAVARPCPGGRMTAPGGHLPGVPPGTTVPVPGKGPARTPPEVATMAIVPVLLYHSISDDPPGWIAEFNVRPADFAAHLDAVLASGRRPITVARLVEAQHGGRPLDGPGVVITFDDGFADFASNALPLLAA